MCSLYNPSNRGETVTVKTSSGHGGWSERTEKRETGEGEKKEKAMVGGDIWGDIGNAFSNTFDPAKNNVSNTFQKAFSPSVWDPAQNGISAAFKKAFDPNDKIKNSVNQALGTVADAFKPGGSAEDFGKQIASALIHQGIPQATAFICGTLAEAAFPEGGPAAGFAGSQAGKALGNAIADKVGQSTGYGLKNLGGTLFVKGGAFVRGVPLPIYTDSTKERIQTHGLLSHQRGTRNGLLQGGSFLALGSKGGSFMSPP